MPNLAKRDRVSRPTGDGGKHFLQMPSCANLASMRNPSTFSRHSEAGQRVCDWSSGEMLATLSWWYFRERSFVPAKSPESPSARAMGQWDLPTACTEPKVWWTGHLTLLPSSLPDNGIHVSCIKVDLMHMMNHFFATLLRAKCSLRKYVYMWGEEKLFLVKNKI